MNICIVGAGGKMGCRITDRLRNGSNPVFYLETGDKGIENLKKRCLKVSDPNVVLPISDVVILGVPDVLIEQVSVFVVEKMKPGALLIALDPAAPLDGKLCQREDLSYFIAHPCHPSLFNWEPTEAATRDFYGGISARQSIVCALMKGSDADFVKGETIAKEMYGPIDRSYRITLEQMAMLEPALVETLAQTCIEIIHEGYQRIVEKGVPSDAARDFVLGHLRIQIAVLFKEVDGGFSDAAYKISKRARSIIFKEDWPQIFEMENIHKQVRDITAK